MRALLLSLVVYFTITRAISTQGSFLHTFLSLVPCDHVFKKKKKLFYFKHTISLLFSCILIRDLFIFTLFLHLIFFSHDMYFCMIFLRDYYYFFFYTFSNVIFTPDALFSRDLCTIHFSRDFFLCMIKFFFHLYTVSVLNRVAFSG